MTDSFSSKRLSQAGWFQRLGASSLALLSPIAAMGAESTPKAAGPVSYWKDVRPVFQAQCVGCHQPAKAKGGYVMTNFASLVKGGEDDGAAIVPGNPQSSALIKNILPGPDGQAEMPKKAPPLSESDRALIERWIAQGAVDDTPATARQVWDPAHPPRYAKAPLIAAIDVSPDGNLLALGGFHEVLLISLPDGEVKGRLIGQSERIESVRFSADGQKLAIAGGSPGRMGEIQVWKVADRSLELSQSLTNDTLYGASWSPDGQSIAFGGADKSVRAINAQTGQQNFFILTHEDWVQDTAWSVKGDQVLSVGRDMTAKLSDFASQRFIDNITSITPGALRGGLQAISRHPLRDEILVVGSTGEPRLYRTNREVERKIGDDSNLIRHFPTIEGRLWTADFAPDGKAFAVGGTTADESASGALIKGTLAFYKAEVDAKIPEELKPIFRKEIFNRTAEEKNKVEAWTTLGVSPPLVVPIPSGVYALSYLPDGKHVIIGGADGTLRLVSTTDGKIVREWSVFAGLGA